MIKNKIFKYFMGLAALSAVISPTVSAAEQGDSDLNCSVSTVASDWDGEYGAFTADYRFEQGAAFQVSKAYVSADSSEEALSYYGGIYKKNPGSTNDTVPIGLKERAIKNLESGDNPFNESVEALKKYAEQASGVLFDLYSKDKSYRSRIKEIGSTIIHFKDCSLTPCLVSLYDKYWCCVSPDKNQKQMQDRLLQGRKKYASGIEALEEGQYILDMPDEIKEDQGIAKKQKKCNHRVRLYNERIDGKRTRKLGKWVDYCTNCKKRLK